MPNLVYILLIPLQLIRVLNPNPQLEGAIAFETDSPRSALLIVNNSFLFGDRDATLDVFFRTTDGSDGEHRSRRCSTGESLSMIRLPHHWPPAAASALCSHRKQAFDGLEFYTIPLGIRLIRQQLVGALRQPFPSFSHDQSCVCVCARVGAALEMSGSKFQLIRLPAGLTLVHTMFPAGIPSLSQHEHVLWGHVRRPFTAV